MLKGLSHSNVPSYHRRLVDTKRGGHYVVFDHPFRGTSLDHRSAGGRHSHETLYEPVVRDTLLRSMNGKMKVNAIGCMTHDFTELYNLGELTWARLNGSSYGFIAPEQCWLVPDAPTAHAKSTAMDVWAVGMVLYYLIFDSLPFQGEDDATV